MPKVDELAVLVDNSGMDIVAITESWLHKDIDDNLLSFSGYNIHRNDRTFSRGGGVCVYCSQNIPCQRSTAVARTLIGGVFIHIFMFCPTSFF